MLRTDLLSMQLSQLSALQGMLLMSTAMGLAGGRAMYIKFGRAGSWCTTQASSCNALDEFVASQIGMTPLFGFKHNIMNAPVLVQITSRDYMRSTQGLHRATEMRQMADQLDAVMQANRACAAQAVPV